MMQSNNKRHTHSFSQLPFLSGVTPQLARSTKRELLEITGIGFYRPDALSVIQPTVSED